MLFSVLKYLLPSEGALCMDIGHYYTDPLANLNSCYTEAKQLWKNSHKALIHFRRDSGSTCTNIYP